MIKNPEIWAKFEHSYFGSQAVDYKQNLMLFEELWNEAVTLCAAPPADPMTGIESDIIIARVLNSCSKNS